MSHSILNDIKHMLGVDVEYDVFDIDIIIDINSAFMSLNQLGVGPKKSFSIVDSSATWEDFTNGKTDIEAVKPYIYLKTRMLFDPPTNSFTIQAFENQIKEFEWRLMLQREVVNPSISPDDMEAMTKEDIDKLFEKSSGQILPDEINRITEEEIDEMFENDGKEVQ